MLAQHLEGVDVVISAVQGGPETIIDGQKSTRIILHEISSFC